jgi:hypothetical protein
MSSETTSSAERVKSAFKLSAKDKKALTSTVKENLPDLDDQDIVAFGVWCEGNKSAISTFSASETAWSAYEAVARKYASYSAFKSAAEKGGNSPDVGTAQFLARQPTAPMPPQKTKEERAQENRERREREEEQQRIDEEVERQRQLELLAAQRRLDRGNTVAPYRAVVMSNAVAQQAWQTALDRYTGSGTGNYGMAPAQTNTDLVAALANWRTYESAITALGDLITGISKFPQPQDKAAHGKGNVGNTLDTREVQANFIVYLAGGGNVNVHVDQSD